MTTPFNDDIFDLADGLEQIYIDTSGPYRALVRKITRAEVVGSGLPDSTVAFVVEPAATPTIGATIHRINGDDFTIVKAELRSHESRWVVFTGTIGSSVQSHPEFRTISIEDADTEYSLALAGVNNLRVTGRDIFSTFRLAFESGKVAAAVDPYHTVQARQTLTYSFKPALDFTLYAASSSGGVALELVTQ